MILILILILNNYSYYLPIGDNRREYLRNTLRKHNNTITLQGLSITISY